MSTPSLLSLSMAAASAAPIPIDSHRSSQDDDLFDMDDTDALSPTSYTSTTSIPVPVSGSVGGREGSVVGLGLGMDDLSLGSPPPEPGRMTTRGAGKARVTQIGFSISQSVAAGASASQASASSPSNSNVVLSSSAPAQAPPGRVLVSPIPISKTGKKRGVDHRCESCDKVYRHPSCLIKHRWEHTPHWRESSKYVLSKHQQVQLLEAAAILSHLNADADNGDEDADGEDVNRKPKKERLPEDRSLWPSFLSGGSLPSMQHSAASGSAAPADIPVTSTPHPPYSYAHQQAAAAHAQRQSSTSASVPSSSLLSTAKGPRMHSYTTTKTSAAGIISGTGVTVVPKAHTPSPASFPISSSVVEVRPGVVGVAHAQHPIAASLPAASTLSISSKKAALSSSSSRHRSSRSVSSRDTKEETLGIPVPAIRTRGYYKQRSTRARSRSITSTTSTSLLSTSVLSTDDVSEVAEDEDMSDGEDEPPANRTQREKRMPGLSMSYSSSSGQSGAKRSMSPEDAGSDIDAEETQGVKKEEEEDDDDEVSDIEVDVETSSPVVYGSYPYPYSSSFHRQHHVQDSSFRSTTETMKDGESAVRGGGAAGDWDEEMEMDMD